APRLRAGARADGELRAAARDVALAVGLRGEGLSAQAREDGSVYYRAVGRELVELANGDLDGDGVIGRVERAAVCIAARSVGQRAVGVADGCAVGERGRGRVVRVGAHEELVAAVAYGEAVVSRRTQARAGR